MQECQEGELVWIPKKNIEQLNLWEGDKIFFRLLQNTKSFFTLKLRYEGEALIESQTKIY